MKIVARKRHPTMNDAQALFVRKVNPMRVDNEARWVWSDDALSAHSFTEEQALKFLTTLVCPPGYYKVCHE